MDIEAGLFDRLLGSSVKDRPTVTPEGVALDRLVDGTRIRPLTTHCDLRGTVMEIMDERWDGQEPIVSAYTFTIRPGVVKGWNLHRRHKDRYVVLSGEMELVMFDPRPGSPTFGLTRRVTLSEHHRALVEVPIDVWHADHNFGTRDVCVVNFPTEAYRHDDPDKYRLPIDTDLIPHSFGPNAVGW